MNCWTLRLNSLNNNKKKRFLNAISVWNMCSIWYARRKLLNELDSYDDYKHEKKQPAVYIL